MRAKFCTILTAIVGALTACLLLVGVQPADAQTRFSISTPKRPTFELSAIGTKLAPELRPAVNANTPLVGLTTDGNPVLEFGPQVQIQQAKQQVEGLNHPWLQLPSAADITSIDRLVVFVNPASINAASIANLAVVSRSAPGGFLVVRVPAQITPDLLRGLVDDPAVRYVEPSFRYSLDRTPNDPRYANVGLWGMRNINAPAAWNLVTDSKVIVALLDTGVEYDHPDISANIWRSNANNPGHDYVNDTEDPRDQQGHGTHVAGTIGAIGNNGVGVVGVSWNVKIIPLKIFGKDNEFGGTEKVAQAIDFAVAHGAKVINNSWGGPNFSQAVKEAINRASQTALFVAAAGNQYGSDNDVIPRYPASFGNDNLIAVMSIDQDEKISGFSNFGRTSVHIAAPGGGIESLMISGSYVVASGTSFATPHVAGAAALIWSLPKYANSKPSDIKKLMLDNARPVAALRDKNVTGGTLDLSFVSGAASQAGTVQSMTITGRLQVPHAAIGAETSGAAIITRNGVVELATTPALSSLQQTLRELSGEQITVTGVPATEKGVERGVRRILQVQ
jgi:thermitase